MSKKIVLLATDRYSINVNDFYMFFRRSEHEIVALVHHTGCPEKSWWKFNRFSDRAREKLFDPMDFESLRLLPWSDSDELVACLDSLEFDYVCMGNGSGAEQQRVVEHVGVEQCLFTEYGWLPWSSHFYISRRGCGGCSEIADVTEEELSGRRIDKGAIEALRRSFDYGFEVRHRDYVYVPLQKDVNDFKFTLTDFSSNEEFLDFVHEMVPRDMTVLVKRHPLYPKQYDLKKYGRFVDITDLIYLNKATIYSNMRALMCINSTSVLEAILFGGRVFAYGGDLFLNKGLVHFGVKDAGEFAAKLEEPTSSAAQAGLISLLLERQVSRRRCVENDLEYVHNHYWNRRI